MPQFRVRAAGLALLAGISLSACATYGYPYDGAYSTASIGYGGGYNSPYYGGYYSPYYGGYYSPYYGSGYYGGGLGFGLFGGYRSYGHGHSTSHGGSHWSGGHSSGSHSSGMHMGGHRTH